jgi:hypothetical protein
MSTAAPWGWTLARPVGQCYARFNLVFMDMPIVMPTSRGAVPADPELGREIIAQSPSGKLAYLAVDQS